MTDEQERLVVDNVLLVHHIARKFHHDYLAHEDLASYGFIGMVKAAKNYDASKNVEFSTVAYTYVSNEIRKSFRKQQIPRKNLASLNFMIGEKGTELGSVIGKNDSLASEFELSELIQYALSKLNERERFVIEAQYGLNGRKEMTQGEIAEIFDVSKSLISKITRIAYKKMQKYLI